MCSEPMFIIIQLRVYREEIIQTWNGSAHSTQSKSVSSTTSMTYCIIPGCRKELELLCPIKDIFHKQESHIPEAIGFLESFYTGTKAPPLQISMATEHDSMLFQPEDESR